MENSTVQPVEVMRRYKVIAVVGASKNPEKEAHTVPRYLREKGYRVIPVNPIPVNPTADEILGEKCYHSLKEIPEDVAREVEVVEVFRPSEELPDVARQVVEMRERFQRPLVFWAQLGLQNDEAKRILSDHGIPYVMDACMRVVHALLVPRS
jgi:predicted CoA-binding protein